MLGKSGKEGTNMIKGLYLMNRDRFEDVYNPQVRARIEELVDIYAPLQTRESIKENPGVLEQARVIFSGWGMVKMDEEFLLNAPNLDIVFYAAGTVKYFVTDASWRKGVRVTSAAAANGIPVAEFTFAQIVSA